MAFEGPSKGSENRSRIRVSDHAVLRYLERIGGFDIERLRGEISRRVTADWNGSGLYVPFSGHSFVVRQDADGPIVTTILEQPRKLRPFREFESND
ncbi:hypothetical protein RHVG_00023 [Rhodovulum phage RS1]|uniref:hypothetical protein n=1 Tax=Rhodobacter phage RC1 TaxID=754055 RepID=UPI0002C1868D|nr:hypothetical protein RHWG_00033 [Rhodobacter phage RC1]YP_007676402.1 hypothetical protein RHVG_00023 [Rhodovulum phage RS1]AGH57988.1 hypothetical protein RHVG_00023 [Rhodovulum phage RS1]AGH58054.1 hypothetical protein RHWG_00033 [Rhodobacter phage RC1]